jgi:hypothetical protein
MTRLRLCAAVAILFVLALVPGQVQARHHHHWHGYSYGLPYHISYLHNYGPGFEPGTFAYYDGPSTVSCAQGAAAYRGQDGHRHPCF